jgi:4-amino-4-deoxy-L-arabinose transferase-like glycosyltransferase
MPSGSTSSAWLSPEPAQFRLSKRRTWAIFTVILLIAAGLRLYEFEATPPGLYLDEAADGANAVQAWETGEFKVFYPEDNGREGLYINVSSVFIHFFGSTAWALRLPAAVFGILTVVGIFALTVELTSPAVALAAAFFLATSYWHVNFSRIAFRAIGAPFFLVWALYFLLLAFRRRLDIPEVAIWPALAGVLYGLGFHTYIAYRVTPVLVIVVLSFQFVEAWRGKWVRRYSLAVGLFIVGAAVAVYPLLVYLLSHPDMATKRVNEVSILRSEHLSQDLAKNILLTAGMLYWQGDANWRHNYDHRPEVFWPVAFFMTLGIAYAIREMLEPTSPAVSLPLVLLLLWIACGAVPAVLSNENVPHALRSILMLPPVAILAAIGATRSLSVLARWISPSLLTAAVIPLACALVGETAYTYFNLWARAPQTSAAFDVENALLARRVNSLPVERTKVVAIQSPSEAADPFYLPLISLRFLTRSVTLEQQKESKINYYTPLTFPVPLPGGSEKANFCAKVKAAMPETIVVCLGNQQR